MQPERAGDPAGMPWTLRLHAAVGFSPLALGLASGLLLTAVFLLQELALGRITLDGPGSSPADPGRLRVAVAHIWTLVYLPTAVAYAVRWSDRTVAQLAPLLVTPPPARSWLGRRVPLRIAGLMGVFGGLAVALTVSPGPVSYDPSTWTPETAWHRILGPGLGFWTGRFIYILLDDSRRLSRLADRIRDLDLLDPEPLRPLVRYGLSNALLIVGFAAVWSLFLVDLAYLPLVGLMIGIAAVVSPVALYIPLRGAHALIRRTKQDELRWCRARIRDARRALEAGEPAPIESLIAWESRIAAVREWPVDASALSRLFLYLLIPLGSWSGGAVVERFIDSLLD